VNPIQIVIDLVNFFICKFIEKMEIA